MLPVETAAGDDEESVERVTLGSLFPPDTLLLLPQGTDLAPELERTWQEAAHHIDLARRRGEDTPSRAELFDAPADVLATLRTFGTVRVVDRATADERAIVFPLQAPDQIDRDIKRLRQVVRGPTPTVILCDNAGQCERLDELLSEGEYGATPAALTVGVLHGGFVVPPNGSDPGLRILTDHEIFRRERRLRRARRYHAGAALDVASALTPGDYVVHLEHGIGIYRGIVTTFVQESAIEVAVIEYEGGDRLNVPLYRLDQIERYRAAGDVDDDAPPPRLHTLGGKRWGAQRDKTRAAIQEMTVELLDLYARRHVATRPAARPRHRLAAAARVVVPLRGHPRPAQGDRPTSSTTWRACGRWTGCSSATSATARRRSPSAPPSRRCSRGGRSRCSSRRRSSPTSTPAPSATGSPTSRSASRC